MKIIDVKFGTTDAETELIRTPEIFDNSFFDPDNNIKELLDGYKFIISGRKGDGKSAYLARMKRLSESNDLLEVITETLENLNSKSFDKFTDEDLAGGKRYVPMWKCIFLIELIKFIENRNFNIQVDNYRAIVDALGRIGLLDGASLEDTVVRLETSDFSISLNNWVTYGHHKEKKVVLRGAKDISNTLLKTLENIYLSDIKFRMIFDGLDDILRSKNFSLDIITGLIRAASETNNFFSKKTFKFKAIVLVRKDILDKCRDPDISKIKTASQINLSWKIEGDPFLSNLSKLILARFNAEELEYYDFKALWSDYFPQDIDGKNSLSYMLENTLYKPRDILMFFAITQSAIKLSNKKINQMEFKGILKKYSENYFYPYMMDELTGFLPDEAINELRTIISKMGIRRFTCNQFANEMSLHSEFDGIKAEYILKLLFERGYIGQYRNRPNHPKEEFCFQVHINPEEVYDPEDGCFIHTGLLRAFGI